jgi:hypothetical protein
LRKFSGATNYRIWQAAPVRAKLANLSTGCLIRRKRRCGRAVLASVKNDKRVVSRKPITHLALQAWVRLRSAPGSPSIGTTPLMGEGLEAMASASSVALCQIVLAEFEAS